MNLDVTYICDGSVSDAYGCSLFPKYRDYKKGEVYNINIELVYANGTGEYSVGDGIDNYAPAGFASGSTFTIHGVEHGPGELLNPLQVGEVHFKWAHKFHDTYTETKNYVSSNYYDEVTKCKYCNYEYWRYIRPAPPPTEECDHNWEYTYNETSHWQYCTECQDTQNKGPHNYTCAFNKDQNKCIMTCSVCGSTKACDCEDCNCGTTHTHNYTNWKDNGDGTHTGTCSCGDKKTEKHYKDYNHATPVSYTDDKHAYYCEKCDYLFSSDSDLEKCVDNGPSVQEFPCGTKWYFDCYICGRGMKVEVKDKKLGNHKYSYTYKNAEYHTVYCTECGYEFGEKFHYYIPFKGFPVYNMQEDQKANWCYLVYDYERCQGCKDEHPVLSQENPTFYDHKMKVVGHVSWGKGYNVPHEEYAICEDTINCGYRELHYINNGDDYCIEDKCYDKSKCGVWTGTYWKGGWGDSCDFNHTKDTWITGYSSNLAKTVATSNIKKESPNTSTEVTTFKFAIDINKNELYNRSIKFVKGKTK